MVKSGKISVAQKTENGYKIEASELFRVFPKKETATATNEQMATPVMNDETLHLHVENARLNAELKAALEAVRKLEEDKEDFKRRLDEETEERRKKDIQLEDLREKSSQKPVEKRKGLFGWLAS